MPIILERASFKAGIPMDTTNIMLSLLFGTCGMGFITYGKKAGRFVPMGVGLMLMVCPYFIANTLVMLIVCGGLMSVPLVLKQG
jgi:hypothetical protein